MQENTKDLILQITNIKCKLHYKNLSQICVDEACQNKIFDAFCVDCEVDNEQYHGKEPHKLFLTIPKFFKTLLDETLVQQQETEFKQAQKPKNSVDQQDLKDLIIKIDYLIQNLNQIRTAITMQYEKITLAQQPIILPPSEQLLNLVKDIAKQQKDISELKKLLCIKQNKILIKGDRINELQQQQKPIQQQEDFIKWIHNLHIIFSELQDNQLNNLQNYELAEQKSSEIKKNKTDEQKQREDHIRQQQQQNQISQTKQNSNQNEEILKNLSKANQKSTNLNNDTNQQKQQKKQQQQLSYDEMSALVFDNGTRMSKVGIAGEDMPKSTFKSIVGRPLKSLDDNNNFKDFYIGEDADQLNASLKLSYPIDRGQISNWEEMEQIWHYSFYNQLRVAPEEHLCLLTEQSKDSKFTREKMTQLMFETFNVPGLYIISPEVLALYASGRTTGIVLDSGEGITRAIAISEGNIVPNSVFTNYLAGMDLNKYMAQILQEIGVNFQQSYCDQQIIRSIKEELCYVALDYQSEQKRFMESNIDFKNFTLPDNQVITVGSQRFRCPEILFNTALVGQEYLGIHQLIFKSIMKCSENIQKDLFKNIVISGGNTMFPGISERLDKELKTLVQDTCNIKIIANPERNYSTWIGGSILASLSTFQTLWITKAEYDENGPSFVHQKCNNN